MCQQSANLLTKYGTSKSLNISGPLTNNHFDEIVICKYTSNVNKEAFGQNLLINAFCLFWLAIHFLLILFF